MRRAMTLVLALFLLSGSLAGISGAAVTGSSVRCQGALRVLRGEVAMEQVPLRTFRVQAKAPKTAVLGGTVSISVVVTRPAEQDPLGQGIPIEGIDPKPAAGVNVGVGLLVGDAFFPGFATTDDAGKATLKVKIQDHGSPGPVDASFYAWKTQADTPCARVDEVGYRSYPKFFSVKP